VEPADERTISTGVFQVICNWFEQGSYEFVAHHLAHLDISDFDPKATPVVGPDIRGRSLPAVRIPPH